MKAPWLSTFTTSLRVHPFQKFWFQIVNLHPYTAAALAGTPLRHTTAGCGDGDAACKVSVYSDAGAARKGTKAEYLSALANVAFAATHPW